MSNFFKQIYLKWIGNNIKESKDRHPFLTKYLNDIEEEKKNPYEKRLKRMLHKAIQNNNFHKFLIAKSDSEYFVLKRQKEDTLLFNDTYRIMIILICSDEELDIQKLIIDSIKKILTEEDDINFGLGIIVRLVSSYHYIKEEYSNIVSNDFKINNELINKSIAQKMIDFSPINSLFIDRLLENKKKLILDKRSYTEGREPESSYWEIINRSINKLYEKYGENGFYTFIEPDELKKHSQYS